MTKTRVAIILALLLFPIAVMLGFGGWALWNSGWLVWLWWLLPVFWGTAHLLSRRWRSSWTMMADFEAPPPVHWTPRDEQALAIIKAKQELVSQIPGDKLIQPQFYLQTAMELATEVAQHYHPRASDPLGSLTVLEFLAAGQLAFEDLEQWFRQFVPGSHLVTVDQWKLLGKAPKWFGHLSNLSWLVSIAINPAANIPRYLASRLMVSPMTNEVQSSLLSVFYTAYVSRVGRYAIEMNSGRLKLGAARYRDALAAYGPPAGEPGPAGLLAGTAAGAATGAAESPSGTALSVPAAERSLVTIAVIGQVKAGKSSLINALLGEQQAAVDVLPTTKDVARYRLRPAGSQGELVLLDTPGYADSGATAAELQSVRAATQEADLALLVMNVSSPARDADRKFMNELAAWFAQQPHRKPTPVLGVLTHLDRLSPVLEWQPPYQWAQPSRPKEVSLRQAIDYNGSVFGAQLAGLVAACTDVPRNRVFGVQEYVLPAMTALLGEARACALLRTLHQEQSDSRVRDLFRQLSAGGQVLLQSWLASLAKQIQAP